MNALDSLRYFLPESFLLIGAFAVLAVDWMTKSKKTVGVLSLLVLILTIVLAKKPDTPLSLFSGFFVMDAPGHFFRLLALGITAVTILASLAYKSMPRQYEGEYYALFLFMAFALILMGTSTNLLMIFMSVEFVSLLSYLMVGLLKQDAKSKEAAVKYLLFGSAASGIMLYGLSLLYGMSGSLELSLIRETLLQNAAYLPPAMLALILVLAGLGFKISMAPFHMWAPDVYEAAPTPVTGFLTVAPKALGFFLLLRVLGTAFEPLTGKWQVIIGALSILTMTIGNITAVAQSNVKRLLAYSSIAQAGYILMGLAVFNDLGTRSLLIYLLTYALTNLGAFTVVIAVSNQTQSDEVASFNGLAKRSPFIAASLTIFLLSLTGIPPLAGFIGKFFVFSSAIQAEFYTLAVAAALNSAVAAFYYFKVIKAMYFQPALEEAELRVETPLTLAIALLLAGVIVIGLMPQPILRSIELLF